MDACHRGNAARRAFPPSAILNGEKIVEALALGLISTGLHSVLICGPSGTGKSVAARSVAILAPDKAVIEIPAGVTPDQLFGTVDLETAIRQGKREPSDSILSRADGNVLIADNINLLPSGILCGLMNAVQECNAAPDAGGSSTSFGCNTLLIGTMNPDEGDLDEHVMDRFDIQIEVTPVPFEKMSETSQPETSSAIRERVIRARNIQEKRFSGLADVHCNAQMNSRMIREYAQPDSEGLNMLRNAMTRLSLSARAYDRILKVSRTIADLEGSENIQSQHIAEAIGYRNLDRENWVE